MKKAIVLLACVVFIFNICAEGLTPTEDKMLSEISRENLSETIQTLVSFSPRLAGSGSMDDRAMGSTHDTAKFIESKLKSYGLETTIEEFEQRLTQVYEYSLLIDFDGNMATPDRLDLTDNSIPFIPRYYWGNISTIDISIQKKLHIYGKGTADFKDAVVLASAYEFWKDNEKLTKDTDSSPARIAYFADVPYTVQHLRYNMFSISAPDAEAIEEKATPDTIVLLTYKAEMKLSKGYNVIGRINGKDDKEVILTAHLDGIYANGAIDNGSGISSLLEAARILSKYRFRHDIVFAFVDAEEVGGDGSKNYVDAHENELEDAIGAINVDCVASGSPDGMTVGFNHKYPDLMRKWDGGGTFWQNQKTDADLDKVIRGVALEILGFEPEGMYVEYIAGGSDFGNFSEKGIPATDIGWIDKNAIKIPAVSEAKVTDASEVRWEIGGKKYYSTFGRFSEVIPLIHTLEDTPENVNIEYVLQTTKVLLVSTERLAKLDDGTQTGIGVASVVILLIVVWIRHRNP